MKYTRLYADSSGETHFEDVEVDFEQRQVRPGGPPIGLSIPNPASDSFFAEAPSGLSTDYHPTPRKQWFIFLTLEGDFGASDGEVRRFGPGDVVLLDDVASKGHTARVIQPGNNMFVGLAE